MIENQDLTGKVAVVTGGSRGIGFAAAGALASAGASVIITGRNSDNLDRAVREIKADSRKNIIASRAFDVSDKLQVSESFDSIIETFHKIDILVNNAGTAVFKPFNELLVSEWEEMISVNLTGVFLCTKAVLPGMLDRNSGTIINIASVASLKTFAGCAAYGAAKSGLLMLTKVLREELRRDGIRITAVIPGATNTGIWDEAGDGFDRSKMIDPAIIGSAVLNVCLTPPSAVIEEIVIRPEEGDL